ncbi:MAG TPA: hypothetical protein VEQ66_12800 [Propionibacteriaceae bacterium]|nr:hypothetical protein [Propionibacteriaceae bacterium]
MARKGLAVGAAVVVVALLPTVSCSSRAPNEAPPAGSAPTKVAPSTTATLNPDTSLERRIRLDHEAAVSAYRTALAEVDRLFIVGGATQPTNKLRKVATGNYLQFTMETLRALKEDDLHGIGTTKVVFAAAQGSSGSTIHVKACEDITDALILDDDGKRQRLPDKRLFVQDYTVSRTREAWKVSDLTSKPVASFDSYGCNK